MTLHKIEHHLNPNLYSMMLSSVLQGYSLSRIFVSPYLRWILLMLLFYGAHLYTFLTLLLLRAFGDRRQKCFHIYFRLLLTVCHYVTESETLINDITCTLAG